MNLGEAIICSTSLINLADEKFLTYPYREVPIWWRRLYTDATILETLLRLRRNVNAKAWTKVIKKLDLAIIVAGAPGYKRLEVILDLIKLTQNGQARQEKKGPLDH